MIVSICIPTFNNTKYLKDCLDSVYLSGENFEYEVLIGIDGCENTLEYIKTLKLNENTKIFYFSENHGPYVVKNTLAKISQSDNLIFFDSDDIMMPNLIKKTAESLKSFDLIKYRMTNFSLVNNEIKEKKTTAWGEGVFGIKKSIFLNFNGFEPWKVAADSDFMGRMYKNRLKVEMNGEVLIYRRLHSEGLTSRKDTGFGSKLRNDYARISMKKNYFGPLSTLTTGKYSIVTNTFELEKENIDDVSEILMIAQNKDSKKTFIDKVLTSHRSNPTQPVRPQIRYEVVNNVTQHRMNQKSQYLNAMIKTKMIPQRHFRQNVK